MKRLVFEALAGAGPVHLVLAESFAVPQADAERLGELGVEIVAAPEGLRLGEAVVYALNTIGVGDVPAHLLHGGLFLSMLPLHADRPDRQKAFLANALRLWREFDA